MLGVPYYTTVFRNGNSQRIRTPEDRAVKAVNVDSVFAGANPSLGKSYINQALAKTKARRNEFEYKKQVLYQEEKVMNLHDIERQRKFTLSLACLIFFFIGAPLGAIIKKGGIGTPLVISVFIFVVYFIFDNMGYKLARDGRTAVWEGIWLSSFVILPMGIFFTYKAVGDSAMFDLESYKKALRRIFGISERRRIPLKEVVWELPDETELLEETDTFLADFGARQNNLSRRPFYKRWFASVCPHALQEEYDGLINKLSYLQDKKLNYKLNQLPLYINRRNWQEAEKTMTEVRDLLAALVAKKGEAPADTTENS